MNQMGFVLGALSFHVRMDPIHFYRLCKRKSIEVDPGRGATWC